jgi:catecholate siderophore receptor
MIRIDIYNENNYCLHQIECIVESVMSSRVRPSSLAAAIALVLNAGSALAQDQTPTEPGTEEVLVRGERTPTDLSSSKFTAPIIDTPKSITVISQSLIAETGSTSLVDALRTVPGITFNAGEGGQPAGDNLKIRGFDAGADVFIDGIRDAGSQTRDVFALEQIEVIKGPGSAYSGRGSSGGSVNLMTKRPREEAFVTTTIGAGTDSYGRVAVDTNFRFGDSGGFRLNLLAQDTDVPGRTAVTTSHAGIAPSLAFGIGKPTRVSLDFYRYETDDVPDYSIPYTRDATNTAPEGGPVDVDRENFYGLVNRDFQQTGADVRTLLVAHDFENGLTFSNTIRYGRTTNDYIVTNPDDGRGNIPNGFVLRNPKSRNSATTTYAYVADFSGEKMTGRIAHSFAFGLEAAAEEMFNRPYVVATTFAGNAVTAFPTSCSAPGAVGATSAYNCTTLASPNPFDPWTGEITPSPSTTDANTDTASMYAFDTLDFSTRWALNLGVRYDDYDTTQDSFIGTTPVRLQNQSGFWNYQAGVVRTVAENGRLYLSTGTSSNPPGNTLGDGTENISLTNQDLEPERDHTYEIGTKWAFVGERLSLTSAIFSIETENARAAVTGGSQATVGDERVEGFEVGLSGEINDRWTIFGSYALLESEIVDDGPVATNEGHEFPNTPRNSFTLWTTFALTQRFTIGGGASYVDARFANAANTISIPEYWRYDAMAALRVGGRVNLQLNVQNLTDEVYYVRPYQSHYAALGPARSAVISATLDF